MCTCVQPYAHERDPIIDGAVPRAGEHKGRWNRVGERVRIGYSLTQTLTHSLTYLPVDHAACLVRVGEHVWIGAASALILGAPIRIRVSRIQ